MSRRGWALFLAMGFIWGIPYALIKVAVDELSPASVVLARTAIGAIVLTPFALRSGALRAAARRWPLVVLFGILEMGIPWLLLGHAEQRIDSGMAGLLIAMVPLVTAGALAVLGDRSALSPIRLTGILIGLVGVGLLVGIDTSSGHLDPLSLAEMLIVVLGYATAPLIVARRLSEVETLGVICLSLIVVSMIFLPLGASGIVAAWPLEPTSVAAIAGLGLICTALAFILFFALIAEVGPARATVITFINPAVAIVLGVTVAGESLTTGMAVGFPLVLAGSWLATRPTSPAAAGRSGTEGVHVDGRPGP